MMNLSSSSSRVKRPPQYEEFQGCRSCDRASADCKIARCKGGTIASLDP